MVAAKSFTECSQVEAEALFHLIPFANRHQIQLMPTRGHLLLQKQAGDYIAYRNGRYHFAEVKAERNASPNLFIELWHDQKTSKEGWLHTLTLCDQLWYYFTLSDDLYILNWKAFRPWVLEHLSRFRQVAQSRHKQSYVTIGLLIPIVTIQLELPNAIVLRHPRKTLNVRESKKYPSENPRVAQSDPLL